MRNQIICLIMCAFLTTPVSAGLAVPVIKAYQYTEYSTGGAGEITIVPSDWDFDPLPYYADVTKNIGKPNSFQTFCMESGEPIAANITYEVRFSDRAIIGGVGPAGDPLSVGTAWLYQEFISGTLVGYDYIPGDPNPPADHRELSAGYLQDAIWWLEGDIVIDPNNIFSNAAVAEFGSVAAAMSDNNGQYNVMVINTWVEGHVGDFTWDTEKGRYMYLIQDTLVPEPATILLFGLGSTVLVCRRRR